MPDSTPQPKKRWRFSYAWAILLLAGATFAITAWTRANLNAPTKLERMIAENEPEEHIHALTVGPDGSAYIGTHLGVIVGRGNSWERFTSAPADVWALAYGGGVTSFFAASDAVGVTRADNQPVLPGKAHALAFKITGQQRARLVAYLAGSGFHRSDSSGETWTKVSGEQPVDILALAFHPSNPDLLVAGGIGGHVVVSTDFGQTWTQAAALPGTVSSLAWQADGQLWAAAEGRVFVSTDSGASWQAMPSKAGERTVVALADGPDGLMGITSEGYLFVQSPKRNE